MAEHQLSSEEQKILALIQQVKISLVPDNKKAITALKNSQKFLNEAIKLLEGTESTVAKPDINSDAPYGLKVDGTPKKAPGRAAKPIVSSTELTMDEDSAPKA